jgi:hypothetical protein
MIGIVIHCRRSGREMTGMPAGIRKLCVAYDVEHYSGRGTRREYATQQRLVDVLEFAFREAGVQPGSATVQEQGDGGLALLPTGEGVDEPRLIVTLLNALGSGLGELNEDLIDQARVRLRVALHQGVVHQAPHGYVGPAVIEVCRLRDSDAARSALASADAAMVAVVAESLYHDVLSQGYHALQGSAFTPVEVQVKSYSGKAWIYVPGSPAGILPTRALPTPASSVGSVSGADLASEQEPTGRAPLLGEFLGMEPDAW